MSRSALVCVVALGAAACGGSTNAPVDASTSDMAQRADGGAGDTCIASGGQVVERMCCATEHPFPQTCTVGACGCSPMNSAPIATCQCPSGTCFDGIACVKSSPGP